MEISMHLDTSLPPLEWIFPLSFHFSTLMASPRSGVEAEGQEDEDKNNLGVV